MIQRLSGRHADSENLVCPGKTNLVLMLIEKVCLSEDPKLAHLKREYLSNVPLPELVDRVLSVWLDLCTTIKAMVAW